MKEGAAVKEGRGAAPKGHVTAFGLVPSVPPSGTGPSVDHRPYTSPYPSVGEGTPVRGSGLGQRGGTNELDLAYGPGRENITPFVASRK